MNMPLMEYKCVWDGYIGQIVSDHTKFTTNEKFDLDIEFDALYFEPDVGNAFKILKNKQIALTQEEAEIIIGYADKFITDKNYPVWAYDDNDLYMGEMNKFDAIGKKCPYTLIGAPDHPASKLIHADKDKGIEEHWERIKLVIRSDGSTAMFPDALCNACVLGITADEYETFPKQPSMNYKWSFTKEAWIDPRSLDEAKNSSKLHIRTVMDSKLWKALGGYTPQYNMATWSWQVEEATAYLNTIDKDPYAEVTSPFIDAFLAARTDTPLPTKKELCIDILKNNTKQKTISAKVMAIVWSYTKAVDACTKNVDVDTIEKKFDNELANGVITIE